MLYTEQSDISRGTFAAVTVGLNDSRMMISGKAFSTAPNPPLLLCYDRNQVSMLGWFAEQAKRPVAEVHTISIGPGFRCVFAYWGREWISWVGSA